MWNDKKRLINLCKSLQLHKSCSIIEIDTSDTNIGPWVVQDHLLVFTLARTIHTAAITSPLLSCHPYHYHCRNHYHLYATTANIMNISIYIIFISPPPLYITTLNYIIIVNNANKNITHYLLPWHWHQPTTINTTASIILLVQWLPSASWQPSSSSFSRFCYYFHTLPRHATFFFNPRYSSSHCSPLFTFVLHTNSLTEVKNVHSFSRVYFSLGTWTFFAQLNTLLCSLFMTLLELLLRHPKSRFLGYVHVISGHTHDTSNVESPFSVAKGKI